MRIYYKGVPIDIRITATYEIVRPDGSKSLQCRIEPVFPGGGGPDEGEPIELPRAA